MSAYSIDCGSANKYFVSSGHGGFTIHRAGRSCSADTTSSTSQLHWICTVRNFWFEGESSPSPNNHGSQDSKTQVWAQLLQQLVVTIVPSLLSCNSDMSQLYTAVYHKMTLQLGAWSLSIDANQTGCPGVHLASNFYTWMISGWKKATWWCM